MLSEVKISPLKKISNEKGDIYHGLKSTDNHYCGFGEAYFTTIGIGKTKGWKKHKKMTLNLIVPVGNVEFHVKKELDGPPSTYVIGSSNYSRLTIPPGYWVAFTGVSVGLNLVLNIANVIHDPLEAEAYAFEKF